MNESNEAIEPICVERILISLDISKHSFAALHAAIELAHHYDATIKGVFIEDVILLSLAEMPFRKEVGEYTAILREITIDEMTRGVFVQSRWVIRTFRKLINQTEISGDISILRGNVTELIDSESEQCDLLVLGKSGTNPLRHRHLGSTTKAIIRNQKKPLLLVEENNRLGYPMIVLFDDSPLGLITIETAGELVDTGETLIILLNEDDPVVFNAHNQKISAWASQKQINISIQSYKSRSFERFLQQINGVKTGLFILPHIQDIPKRRIVELALEKASLPILLIKHPDPE